MTSFNRSKSRSRKQGAALQPQFLACFGPPMVGTSTIINILTAASETPIIVIEGDEPDNDEATIRELLRNGTTVFLDGFNPSTSSIQALHDSRLVLPGHGSLIQFWADNDEILARAKAYGREDVTEEKLRNYQQNMVEVEDLIRQLSMPFYTLPIGMDLSGAVRTLAERAGIKK